MSSMPYYVPCCPKYSLRENAADSKPSSSDIPMALPWEVSFQTTNQEDLLVSLVADRLRIMEAGIRQLIIEMEERKRLRDRMLDDIDQEICAQKEMLFQVAPNGVSPFTVGDPRRRSAIEKEIASLDAEKRAQETSAWKDVSTLKKELRELGREYLEEKRKQRVISE